MKHSLRAVAIFALALLWLPFAVAQEMLLFNVAVLSSTEIQLHEAALSAEAKLVSAKPGHRIYDVGKLGVPGARRLEILFDLGQFVMAQYSFNEGDASKIEDYELRRLLVARYGNAYLRTRDKKRKLPYDISSRYVECTSCVWDFDASAELIYTNLARNPAYKTFGNEFTIRLTYLSRERFEALQKRLDEADQASVKERASNAGTGF